MKKQLFTLLFTFIVLTVNAQSVLKGDMNDDGIISIADVMKLVDIILGNTPPQSFFSCPDDNHPHMIDLGLPSGTKWACCNVGATKPEDYGGYYAWGETEEKDVYNWSTYTLCEGSKETCINLGKDIACTEYDVAYVKWGNQWRMPSSTQMNELKKYCVYEFSSFNGVPGGKIIGPSGGTIFLPASGVRKGSELFAGFYGESDGFYWSSTWETPYLYNAIYLWVSSGAIGTNYGDYRYRFYGQSIRPVSR